MRKGRRTWESPGCSDASHFIVLCFFPSCFFLQQAYITVSDVDTVNIREIFRLNVLKGATEVFGSKELIGRAKLQLADFVDQPGKEREVTLPLGTREFGDPDGCVSTSLFVQLFFSCNSFNADQCHRIWSEPASSLHLHAHIREWLYLCFGLTLCGCFFSFSMVSDTTILVWLIMQGGGSGTLKLRVTYWPLEKMGGHLEARYGALIVTLHRCDDLAVADVAIGSSDPYVKFTCNGKSHRSDIVYTSLSPRWFGARFDWFKVGW